MMGQLLGGAVATNRNGALLQWALLADATVTGASVALVLAAPDLLSPHLGFPVGLLRGAGVILIPFVALLVIGATRPRPPAPLIGLIVVLNVAWAVASVILLMSSVVTPTALGIAVVVAQAAAVLAIAALQYLGLQRTARA